MAASSLLFLVIAATGQQGVDQAKLVGLWEVAKGTQPPVGSTLEFAGDGTFKSTIKGQAITFAGDFKLEGDQLTLTPPGLAMSVRELTRDKLVVDGNGSTIEYRRKGAVAASSRKAAMPKVKAAGAPRLQKVDSNAIDAWGTEVDPDNDVKIKASGRSLSMEIPGTPHVLAPPMNTFNAPRVVTQVSGDFVAIVQVDGAFAPGRESTTNTLSSRQAGGLILWKGSDNHIVLQRRTVVGKEGKSAHQVIFDEHASNRRGESHLAAVPEGSVFLRLERQKNLIRAASSSDGRQWKSLKPIEATWADGPLQVGVMAVNTSTEKHSVTFSNYSLKVK
jgi:regulation of enolase protein 1 (concanavalin A-like superfamily)